MSARRNERREREPEPLWVTCMFIVAVLVSVAACTGSMRWFLVP